MGPRSYCLWQNEFTQFLQLARQSVDDEVSRGHERLPEASRPDSPRMSFVKSDGNQYRETCKPIQTTSQLSTDSSLHSVEMVADLIMNTFTCARKPHSEK